MEGFQFFCSQPFLFLFLLLSDCQFLIPDLPKLTELPLFLEILGFLLVLPVNLLLSRALNRVLHLQSPSFLLFEEPQRLFLGFSHLLVEDLVLPVLHASEDLSLSVYQFLSGFLFLLKLLILFVPSELMKSVSFAGVLFNLLLFFEFLALDFFLHEDQFLVGFLELFSHFLLLEFPLKLFLSFFFDVFFYLSFDKLALKHFVLNTLYNLHFKLVELVVDYALVFHFLFILLQQLGPNFLIVFVHLDLLQLLPLLLDLLLDLLLLLP